MSWSVEANGDLLAIDFARELRLLSSAQLRGAWQVPAELVRRSLASGAGTVEVSLGQRRLTVSDTGEPLPPDLVRKLATVLDRDSAGERRHDALVALENAGAMPLVWCAALARSSFILRSAYADGGLRVELQPGARTLLSEEGPSRPTGTEVCAHGVRIDQRRSRWWLGESCRWVRDRITVDGRPPEGLTPRAMISWKPRDPLPIHLSIPPEGDSARLWLLRHGILSTRASLPGYPAFDAAIEMSAELEGEPSGAALLEAVTPHLRRLADLAVRLMIELAQRCRSRAPWAQHRASALLLQAAKAGLRRQEILGLPFITVVDLGERTHTSPIELAAAGGTADPPATLRALAPDEDPTTFVLGAGPVVVLSPEERDLLADLIGTRFSRPPSTTRSRRMIDRIRSTAALLSERARAWRPWNGTAKPLPPEGMSEQERLFHSLVRSLGEDGSGDEEPEVVLCRGAGRVRRRGRVWLAPRHNPLVRQSVEAVASEPARLYPALIALMGGKALPQPQARDRWLAHGARSAD